MNRNACGLVSSAIVTSSAFAGFFFLSRPLLRLLSISEYARGADVAALLAICILCVLAGTVVGLFIFPVVLRPFVSSSDFWGWIGTERGIKIPYLDSILDRWATLLYGRRPHQNALSR